VPWRHWVSAGRWFPAAPLRFLQQRLGRECWPCESASARCGAIGAEIPSCPPLNSRIRAAQFGGDGAGLGIGQSGPAPSTRPSLPPWASCPGLPGSAKVEVHLAAGDRPPPDPHHQPGPARRGGFATFSRGDHGDADALAGAVAGRRWVRSCWSVLSLRSMPRRTWGLDRFIEFAVAVCLDQLATLRALQ